jgi:hypothetical protein
MTVDQACFVLYFTSLSNQIPNYLNLNTSSKIQLEFFVVQSVPATTPAFPLS